MNPTTGTPDLPPGGNVVQITAVQVQTYRQWKKLGKSPEAIAARLGITLEALEMLGAMIAQQDADVERRNGPPQSAAAIEKTSGLSDADLKELNPLQRVIYDTARTYNQLGEGLSMLGAIANGCMGPEACYDTIREIRRVYDELLEPRPQYELFLSQVLHNNYILVRRPTLVSHDEAAQQSTSETSNGQESKT